MTIDEFFARYNGKGLDYDGLYGNQCVDLIEYYLQDVFGMGPFYANAKDWYYNFGGNLAKRFERITNNPNNYNQVPKHGDIIIWNGSLPGSGGYGHIAIFDAVVSPGTFRSFDQNWGGMYCHFVNHNWNYILGWLTPNSAPAPQPQGGNEVANREQVNNIYRGILFRDGDQGGLDNYTGRDANSIVSEMLGSGERKELENRVNGQNAQLQEMQNKINELNQTVTTITANDNASKADLKNALTKVSELTSELESAHDQITDLQNKPPQIVEKPVEVNPNWLQNVISFIRKVLGIK